MKHTTIQFVRGLVILPFLSASSSLAMLQTAAAPVSGGVVSKSLSIALDGAGSETQEDLTLLHEERAAKIDAYFAKRNMPLEGYGAKMVEEAFKNDLDWRLLPAIAIRESTGGKFACQNNPNPFGWGSCKIKFKSFDESIEVVAKNLGGNNPGTEYYYKDKTIEEKLAFYNSVIPAYTAEIFEFMDLIEQGK